MINIVVSVGILLIWFVVFMVKGVVMDLISMFICKVVEVLFIYNFSYVVMGVIMLLIMILRSKC